MEDISTLYLRGNRVLFKRRRSERNACQTKLFGELILPDSGEFVETRVLDLSEKGIGCMVPKKIGKNTRAYIHLKKSEAASTFVTISLNVAHCTGESHGDWRIGCEFTEALAPPLLDYLLG
jgi:hypothetical protein